VFRNLGCIVSALYANFQKKKKILRHFRDLFSDLNHDERHLFFSFNYSLTRFIQNHGSNKNMYKIDDSYHSHHSPFFFLLKKTSVLLFLPCLFTHMHDFIHKWTKSIDMIGLSLFLPSFANLCSQLFQFRATHKLLK
jgi:hypothetical protein